MDSGSWGFDVVELAEARKRSTVDLPAVLPQRDLYSVRPPEVRPGPDRIEWRWQPLRGLPGAPASVCLFNFLKLADSDGPEDFARYAAVHGVLNLSENGLPSTFTEEGAPFVPGQRLWRFEPVNLWKAYAQDAKMLLVLAMALRESMPIDPIQVLENAGFAREDFRLGDQTIPMTGSFGWLELDERDVFREPIADQVSKAVYGAHLQVPGLTNITLIYLANDLATQRRMLTLWLESHWLGLANIAPTVKWSSEPAHLILGVGHRRVIHISPGTLGTQAGPIYLPANTLFSVLAAELTGIICSDRYVAQCHRCLTLHPSRIKVRTDQPNYCDSCRVEVRRATNRNAARKRYERQKAERVQAGDTQVDTLAAGHS
jgi:hypothetical protein